MNYVPRLVTLLMMLAAICSCPCSCSCDVFYAAFRRRFAFCAGQTPPKFLYQMDQSLCPQYLDGRHDSQRQTQTQTQARPPVADCDYLCCCLCCRFQQFLAIGCHCWKYYQYQYVHLQYHQILVSEGTSSHHQYLPCCCFCCLVRFLQQQWACQPHHHRGLDSFSYASDPVLAAVVHGLKTDSVHPSMLVLNLFRQRIHYHYCGGGCSVCFSDDSDYFCEHCRHLGH
mmetsp:Transcript_1164/g.1890  ORF Transcript_1164/g.1890 Transcript_1164/m.1890 type:complete len:227 (-) Transcript_1164:1189-1869(-)